MENKHSKVLKWSVIIGIIIVLNLFFNYTIDLFYNEPEWDDFCENKQTVERVETKEECLDVGGQWVENGMVSPRSSYEVPAKIDNEVKSYCNPNYTCSQNYDDARNDYRKNIFIILTLLGVISIIVGIFIGGISEVVATGLSYGGVLSLIIASMRYWSDASNILRFGILAIALIVLIWFAIKKFKD